MNWKPAQTGIAPKTAFVVAWAFFAVSAGFGVMLRLQLVHPVEGLNYAHVLHAHSHLGFLGWVFNAFFALSLRFFTDPRDGRCYRWLFVVFQVANLGMLVAFPLQGYARESIIFSTLHMVGAGWFAWLLWHRNRASPEARRYLGAALAFMLVSGVGPLVLGPVAVAGLRDSPWYAMAIYWYLHFQYNGWFVFFLIAVLVQAMHERGCVGGGRSAGRALPWLAAGCAGTFALSALWMAPSGWVFAVAALGAALQAIGGVLIVKVSLGAAGLFASGDARMVRLLALIALGAFALKNLLQLAAAWPDLAALINHRYSVIAFLHLVFLGIATPMLIAWAVEAGWLRLTAVAKVGLWSFLAGGVTTGVVLASAPLGGILGVVPWLRTPEALLVGAIAMAAGILVLGFGFWSPGSPDVRTEDPRRR